MPRALRDKWLEMLRSLRPEQQASRRLVDWFDGEEFARHKERPQDAPGFTCCAVGALALVLCNSGAQWQDPRTTKERMLRVDMDWNPNLGATFVVRASPAHRLYQTMQTELTTQVRQEIGLDAYHERAVSSYNDKQGMSFVEIANFIEEVL